MADAVFGCRETAGHGPPFLSLQGVGHALGTTPTTVLSDVSFNLEAGQLVVLLGANGSGKSTLARLVCGLIVPDRGRVCGRYQDTACAAGRAAVRRSWALVSQGVDQPSLRATVADEVGLGPENHGLAPRDVAIRVRAALEAVDLWALAGRHPRALSGGERQRLAVAGALAMGCAGLCLDEPTALLDARGRSALWALALRLRTAGHAVLWITQRLEEAGGADRVLVLERGRLCADGSPQAGLAAAALHGLGEPAAVRLARALRAAGVDPGPAPLRVEDLVRTIGGRSPVPPSGRAPDGPPRVVARRRARRGAGAPRVRLLGVAHRFGGVPALRGVRLAVRAGECVCLLGASGAGKSTLLQIAAALLRPQAGRVAIAGGFPWEAPWWRRGAALRAARRQAGLVWQLPEQQFFGQTVGDELMFAPRNAGAAPVAARAAASAAAEVVGLDPGLLARSPFTLSGGEARRVAIAALLAAHPAVLLLDEPTAALDAPGQAAVRTVVRRLRRRGVGCLLVTHDAELAAALADRLVVLHRGRVVARGRPAAVFARGEALARWGLQPPATSRLLQGLRAAGLAVPPSAPGVRAAAGLVARALAEAAAGAAR